MQYPADVAASTFHQTVENVCGGISTASSTAASNSTSHTLVKSGVNLFSHLPLFAHPEHHEERVRSRIEDEEARYRRLLVQRRDAYTHYEFYDVGPCDDPDDGRSVSPTSSATDTLASSSVSSLSSFSSTGTFSSTFSFSNIDSERVQNLVDTADIDVLLAKLDKRHRKQEKRRDHDGLKVIYKRGDNRYDAEKRRKIEDREEERRDDIEIVEGMRWKGMCEKVVVDPLHKKIELFSEEQRARKQMFILEREAVAALYIKFSKLNLGLQVGFVSSFFPEEDGTSSDTLAGNMQGTFFFNPKFSIDPAVQLVMRGVENGEKEKRRAVEISEKVECVDLFEDMAIVLSDLQSSLDLSRLTSSCPSPTTAGRSNSGAAPALSPTPPASRQGEVGRTIRIAARQQNMGALLVSHADDSRMARKSLAMYRLLQREESMCRHTLCGAEELERDACAEEYRTLLSGSVAKRQRSVRLV